MAFSSFMNQDVTITPKDGPANRFGIRGDGATFTVKGWIEDVDNMVLSIRGREVTIDSLIFLPTGTDIADQYRVAVADRPGVKMEVFSVRRCRVGSGANHHLEVQVGRVSRTAGGG